MSAIANGPATATNAGKQFAPALTVAKPALTLIQGRKPQILPTISKLSILDGFAPQQKAAPEKAPQVVHDPVLEQVLSILKSVLDHGYDVAYESGRMPELRITAAQIEQLSVLLAAYQEHRNFGSMHMSRFISELINASPDTDFVFRTEHLSKKIYWFCYGNRKNVTVIGDLGADVGYGNTGNISVQGNAGSVNDMKGGLLEIRGNLNGSIWKMRGGDVFIKGVQIFKGGQLLEKNYRSIMMQGK